MPRLTKWQCIIVFHFLTREFLYRETLFNEIAITRQYDLYRKETVHHGSFVFLFIAFQNNKTIGLGI